VFSCSNAARLFEAAVGGAVVAVYAMGQLCLLSLWGGGVVGGGKHIVECTRLVFGTAASEVPMCRP